MLLLKVINLSHPAMAYILALANSFGGSLIIIGSVSNIIVVQQAQQLGVNIGLREFSRLSIPATLLAGVSLSGTTPRGRADRCYLPANIRHGNFPHIPTRFSSGRIQ